ncbi:hypothetical protein WOLCODRAFT_53844, partial [Wolfiporia cocos MD-104 SS10]
MIVQKYMPYQNIPNAPGKMTEEICKLGMRLFPFTLHSFELAMSMYDWMMASFTQMVIMKIFQYMGIEKMPFPLDQPSIATEIFESNWGTYILSNPDYMNSFMMEPASSVDEVKAQLDAVAPKLHEFSNVQNHLFAVVVQALLHTSPISMPRLFSGQVNIYQLGMDHFGIEFLKCPLNKGPTTEAL